MKVITVFCEPSLTEDFNIVWHMEVSEGQVVLPFYKMSHRKLIIA